MYYFSLLLEKVFVIIFIYLDKFLIKTSNYL